nr:putative Co/Zn/Cd efflux system rane fusion protein [Acidobacteriota bacterium]
MTQLPEASATANPPLADSPPPPPPPKGRRLLWFLTVPVLLVCAALVTVHARGVSSANVTATTKTLAVLNVNVLHAQAGSSVTDLTAPGTIQAFSESPVYARITGYVRSWTADLGARVRKGQLLAIVDAPEIDQELSRARAMLTQARATRDLATVTAARYRELITSHSVSQQEVDNNNQNLNAQVANVEAATAEVGRLEQMQGFEKIYAPFDGVITARKTQVGDLVNAGNSGTGTELFRISDIATMRVYVNVPETYSGSVAPGVPASMAVASLANRTFGGKVARTSHAIGVSSRTLLTEVDVPNPKGELMPGAYARVQFHLTTKTVPLVLPGSTILFQAKGPHVGVVNDQGHVELRQVTLGRDFGTSIEVVSGIAQTDAVIANPPDYLVDGIAVSVQPTQGGK